MGRRKEVNGPQARTRAGASRIGMLMAEGLDYASARDEARLINMREYQSRRYHQDAEFRERVKQRRRNYYARTNR